MPYLDPWGWIITFTSAASVTLSGIIDNRALQFIGGAEYLTAVNLGSAMAYPEHAGAAGSGTTDDYSGIKYALLSGQASLSGVYEINTNITVTNDVILIGPSSSAPLITAQGRIVISEGISISTGYLDADGIVLDIIGSLPTSRLNIRNSYVTIVSDAGTPGVTVMVESSDVIHERNQVI